jgi:Co/Zn/Cd efflux system component
VATADDAPSDATSPAVARAYTRVIWAIALGILALGAGTVAAALALGNDQLFKDGVDWVYDVVLYGIAAIVFGRDARAERLAAAAIGTVLATAGLHTLWDLAAKIATPRPIEIAALGFSAGSAVVVAVLVVVALWRFRAEPNPVIKATWLSSRNDLVSTTGFAMLGLAARTAPVRWPEYLFDLFVAGLCFQASYAIWRSLRRDGRAAVPELRKIGTTGSEASL